MLLILVENWNVFWIVSFLVSIGVRFMLMLVFGSILICMMVFV